jgi:hypothetical protein
LEPFFGRLFLLVRVVLFLRMVLFLVEVALGGNGSWDFAGFS